MAELLQTAILSPRRNGSLYEQSKGNKFVYHLYLNMIEITAEFVHIKIKMFHF